MRTAAALICLFILANAMTGPGDEKETHHGYWMALTLHEIAPEAEIFALATHTLDEAARVEAMIQALD